MPNEGAKAGMTAAVDAIGLPEAQDEAEQLDLLGLPPVSLTPEGAALLDGIRARGRPAGSRNKRTLAWADYLLSRHANPVEVLLQIAESSVAELVLTLKCSPLEALQEKRHAAVAAAPYVMQKQAVAVDLTGSPPINLTITRGDGAVAAGVGAGLAGRIIEVLENQELSEGASDEVEHGGSADGA